MLLVICLIYNCLINNTYNVTTGLHYIPMASTVSPTLNTTNPLNKKESVLAV